MPSRRKGNVLAGTLVLGGFTLIELLVVVAIIGLLISILLPGLREAREVAKTTVCMTHLRSLGQSTQQVFGEYRGYGPTWDDGECGTAKGHQEYMLSWVDVLNDLNLVGDGRIGICPVDERPDEPARIRGKDWRFSFVDVMRVGETPKRGVRTSYALNAIMHWNHPADRFPDTSRQIYALDGWWTWFGSINAYWLMYGAVFGQSTDIYYPHWEATMAGWRHGKRLGSNILYVDGHVVTVYPRVPRTLEELERTVDTSRTFTWLPGERTTRFDFDPYEGDVEEWRGRYPAYLHQSGKKLMSGMEVPAGFPEELAATERTNRDWWRKFPNNSSERK